MKHLFTLSAIIAALSFSSCSEDDSVYRIDPIEGTRALSGSDWITFNVASSEVIFNASNLDRYSINTLDDSLTNTHYPDIAHFAFSIDGLHSLDEYSDWLDAHVESITHEYFKMSSSGSAYPFNVLPYEYTENGHYSIGILITLDGSIASENELVYVRLR